MPSWLSFNSADGSLTGTPTNDDVGSFANIVITVSDGLASNELAAFTLTVHNTNDAPTIHAGASNTAIEDQLFVYSPVADDVDVGDVALLSFSVSNLPSWASFDNTSGAITGTPSNDDVGSYANVSISVSDPSGSSASLSTFTIAVVNSNDAPTINGTPVTSTNEDSVYQFIPSAADVDGRYRQFFYSKCSELGIV